ncbi:MAG: VWA domain-containing protein [Woeseiaceae bacterium]|nr:VWA domain-containing protein [Woeseiaceae bacterium]
MSALELFHFLRPWWLVALPLVALVWYRVRWRERAGGSVGELVAPHLRDALTVNRASSNRVRPIDGTAIALLFAAIAAAGPTWSKQQSPWFSETAPLVVALEVTDAMRSNDVQPTRLDRARFKVLDLIERRTGSRTALIAYAGSAHIVMPPTTDIDVIKPFLESLDPAIMPEPGRDAGAVLPIAQNMLADEATIGTVLFVNSGFDARDIPSFAGYTARGDSAAVLAFVVGTDAGGVALMPDGSPVMDPAGGRLDTSIDTAVLRRVRSEADVPVVRSQAGDADVREMMRRIESNLRQADDPDSQWIDGAWWFTLPAALLVLAWFRRGWTMRW